jgi:hypothetical protein
MLEFLEFILYGIKLRLVVVFSVLKVLVLIGGNGTNFYQIISYISSF